MGKTLSKQKYQNIVDDICVDSCSCDTDCILKIFLVSFRPDPRMMIQLKCVQKFKEVLAKEQGVTVESIEWDAALMEWADRGLAEKFDSVYKNGMLFSDVYKLI